MTISWNTNHNLLHQHQSPVQLACSQPLYCFICFVPRYWLNRHWQQLPLLGQFQHSVKVFEIPCVVAHHGGSLENVSNEGEVQFPAHDTHLNHTTAFVKEAISCLCSLRIVHKVDETQNRPASSPEHVSLGNGIGTTKEEVSYIGDMKLGRCLPLNLTWQL
jgi:hypothetical protein